MNGIGGKSRDYQVPYATGTVDGLRSWTTLAKCPKCHEVLLNATVAFYFCNKCGYKKKREKE